MAGCKNSIQTKLYEEEKEASDSILVPSMDSPNVISGQERTLLNPLEPITSSSNIEESAAAKKNRRKKEKEKEKKVAAAASTTSEKPAEGEKKKPVTNKGRQLMLASIAKHKEAIERKKREEDERVRKEEEERQRREELERQTEEAKRKKKEREREKVLKKRLEGKLLTGKQRDENRRLEAMRNQFLANKGISLAVVDNVAPAKRPIYSSKKSKAQLGMGKAKSTGVAKVEEEENKDEAPPALIKEIHVEVEQRDDDDEEWEALNDVDRLVPVKSVFRDEEVDSEAEPGEAAPLVLVPNAAAGAKSNFSETSDSALQSKGSEGNLRSPICCIMGHVDAGKTKLLDCIRGTNVQQGEAGGITQQIGATFIPADHIRERTKELKADAKLKVPGLLVIDTPGHESFANLRSRGSGLCDIAILVVDIMHGLGPQTVESLNLLKPSTEFIVVLNKVDRIFGWETCRNAPIRKAIKHQSKDVQSVFNSRLDEIITQFKEQGLNTELYYKNREMGETVSIVPTTAISGEGIPDLLLLLAQWTQRTMVEKLTLINEVQCTVLEVKVVEGHGTTIDVILVNGVLREGDQIVVCGMQRPIVTTIRALLTTHPMKELRVKGSYLHHKEIKGAQGIKITAQDLEHAVAGTSLHVVGPDDDLEEIKALAMEDMERVMSRIDTSGTGVCVQASTLGSLEALLEFLRTPEVNVPVSGIGIGPVHNKDVKRASAMLDKEEELATILAFDVKVTSEARELAGEVGVKIFTADVIYHLFDQFKAYIRNLKEERRKEAAEQAVFPCVLKIIPDRVYRNKDPIILGFKVLEGTAKVGTPICIPSREVICIGRIASIENNQKQVGAAKKGEEVSIKIVGSNAEERKKMYGRHFGDDDELVSQISRRSIDALKANYREDLSDEDWKLIIKLKRILKIQ